MSEKTIKTLDIDVDFLKEISHDNLTRIVDYCIKDNNKCDVHDFCTVAIATLTTTVLRIVNHMENAQSELDIDRAKVVIAHIADEVKNESLSRAKMLEINNE